MINSNYEGPIEIYYSPFSIVFGDDLDPGNGLALSILRSKRASLPSILSEADFFGGSAR